MKKFAWSFEMGDDTISGETDTRDEVMPAMEKAGFDESEMTYTLRERSDEEMVAHARASANPPRIKSSLANLSDINDTLFKQVDGLKNAVAEMEMKLSTALFDRQVYKTAAEDATATLHAVRELVIAWNTEQHARLGAAHIEPAFVVILREWQESKALQRRKHVEEEVSIEKAADTAVLARDGE